jgi:Putative Flp pilus-assembly TadE/G-like
MRMVNHNKRKAAVVVLIAFCLIVLLGLVAIAIDGGLILDDKQRVQAAADAAAMAAANNLFLDWQTNFGADTGGDAKAAAVASATANGFPNITVNIPPLSGPFKGLAGYVEVYVHYDQKRQFSSIFGSGDIGVEGRAVAQGRWVAAKIGILVLDPTAPGAATIVGGAQVSVTGVPFIIDSNAPDAATATGGGTVTASEFDITGNPGTSGSGVFNGPIVHGPPTPDPLAYLPEPDPSTMIMQDKNGIHISNGTKTISPGIYRGGITVSGQGTLVMQPGIYYMDGGGFSFTGQGSLVATGVMIVNAPKKNSDVININGSGSINLTPMTTGIYAGISLWQTRDSTNTVAVSGNGGSVMTGTFYTQHGTLNVTGNGTNNTIGSQYISDLLVVNGNGAFNVDWNANAAGRMRLICLVE